MNIEMINKNLQKEIDREVMIKNVTKRVQSRKEKRKALAREKIEDIKAQKAIDEYFDYE